MPDELNQVLHQLEKLSEQMGELREDVATIKAWRVEQRLDNYGDRIGKLETWSSRLIGAYTAGALLLGLGFQFLLKVLGV